MCPPRRLSEKGELNESSTQIVNLNLGNCISGEFIRADLRISRLFHRQSIFRGITEAPKSAGVFLVSLVFYCLPRRRLRDSVVVSHIPQALRETVEMRLTDYPLSLLR